MEDPKEACLRLLKAPPGVAGVLLLNGEDVASPKGDAEGLPAGVVEAPSNTDGFVSSEANTEAGGFPKGVVEAFPNTDGFGSSFTGVDSAVLSDVACMGEADDSCKKTGFGGSLEGGVSTFPVAHTGLVGVADGDVEPNDANELAYAPNPPAAGAVGVVGAAAAGAPKVDFPKVEGCPNPDCPNATAGFAPNPLWPNAGDGFGFEASTGVVALSLSSFF